MPSRCSISKCKASKDPLSKHVFKIPKDPAVKSHWIKFFEDNGVTFDETKLVIYRLCAAHFPKDVVEIFGSRARIAMNAIPVHNRNTKKAFVVPPPRSYAYKKLTDETTDANITSLRTTYNTSSTSALKRGPYIKRKQMIIKEVKSFKAKCRCCLKQEVTVKHFEVSPKIENWFSELLQTEFERSEKLSNTICAKCHSVLSVFSSFKESFLKNQELLKNMIGQDSDGEEIPDPTIPLDTIIKEERPGMQSMAEFESQIMEQQEFEPSEEFLAPVKFEITEFEEVPVGSFDPVWASEEFESQLNENVETFDEMASESGSNESCYDEDEDEQILSEDAQILSDVVQILSDDSEDSQPCASDQETTEDSSKEYVDVLPYDSPTADRSRTFPCFCGQIYFDQNDLHEHVRVVHGKARLKLRKEIREPKRFRVTLNSTSNS